MAITANGSGSGGGGGGGGGAGSSSTDSPFVIEHDDDSVLDNDYLEGGSKSFFSYIVFIFFTSRQSIFATFLTEQWR